MERRSGRTNSASRCRGVSIIRLVGRRPEPLLRRGLGKSDPPLLLYGLERFCFGSFRLWRHPDLAGGGGSRDGLWRASSSGLLFQQWRSKNARLSPLFDVVEGLNRKIFRPTFKRWQAKPCHPRLVRCCWILRDQMNFDSLH